MVSMITTKKMEVQTLVEEEYRSLADSAEPLKNEPILSDCFFGNGTSDVFLSTKKFCFENLSSTTLFNSQGSPASSCESSWGLDTGYDQFESRSGAHSQFHIDLENFDIDRGDWLEKWMDLNGVFDPHVELPCSDIDVSFRQSHQNLVGTDSSDPVFFHDSAEQCEIQKAVQQNLPLVSNLAELSEKSSSCDQTLNEGFQDYQSERKVGSYMLKTISKERKQEISAIPITICQIRSAKVIKASNIISEAAVHCSRNAKCTMFHAMIERKREQNRSAAIRYREKRRKEAVRRKEELHELELRNVALRTEASGLTAEICYLKRLLHDVLKK